VGGLGPTHAQLRGEPMGGVAGGRYTAVLRGDTWIVRSPDGKVVKRHGTDVAARNAANAHAARLNEKLRAVDGK
jgi:hypothetical protein